MRSFFNGKRSSVLVFYALVGSLSTLVSLPFAWLMGRGYDGGIDSLVAGFAVLAMAALITTCITERALPWKIAG